MEDWAEIRRLHRAEGMPIKVIARRLEISRNAVRRALGSDDPPKYQRAAPGSAVDVFEPQIRALLAEFPEMPATVIAERLGWTRSITVFRKRVSELRPLYAPTDPASRTDYLPGELAQCDLWFPAVDIPLGMGQSGRPPVLVMASAYSRMISAIMLPSRQAPDLIAGHWQLLTRWQAVPRALVWDNEAAVGSWRAGKPKLTDDFEVFRGMLGIRVIQCRPRDPEAKGIVERANQYLETSFLPGRAFTSPMDFNAQLGSWLAERAARRMVRSLGAKPMERWEADRSAMLTLPPITALGWQLMTRLPRDHYVRLASNDYSVDPIAVGRMVSVHADTTTVTVRWGERVVASHARHWGTHQTITDPTHLQVAERMRRDARAGQPPLLHDEVEQRSLTTYDRLLEAV